MDENKDLLHVSEADTAESAIRDFFIKLYGNLDEDAYLVLWAKDNKLVESFSINNIDEAVKFALEHSNEYNLCFNVCLQKQPPPSGKRGKAEGAYVMPGLWMDVDIKGEGHNTDKNYPENEEVALDIVNGLPWGRPSIVINSGGGFHVYWLFNEPWVLANDQDWKRAASLSARFQKYVINRAKENNYELDNTSDLARPLRVPGTINHKYGKIVKIVTNEGYRYNPEDFEECLGDVEAPANSIKAIAADDEYPSVQFQPIYDECEFVRHCVDDAATLPEPEWTTFLTIAVRCEDGDSLAHQHSSSHPKYTREETAKKIIHVQNNLNPQTCEYIKNGVGFEACIQCKHFNNIKSPILLGFPSRAPKSMTVEDRFPYGGFPMEVMPKSLADSLEQLAESCSIPPTSLPAKVFAVIASLLGDRVSFVPKEGWEQPAVIWGIDVAESGQGKTGPQQVLVKYLENLQEKETKAYLAEKMKYDANEKLGKNKKEPMDIPNERGYIITNYTIEGIARELQGHPTGGILCSVEEFSAVIGALNQYKKNGNDREEYLKLYDGSMTRISRAKERVTISNPRVSIIGGIQPKILAESFGKNNWQSISDGTLPRHLITYQPIRKTKLTSIAWTIGQRDVWEGIVNEALKFGNDSRTIKIVFSADALNRFVEWVNEIEQFTYSCPESFRPFIHKSAHHCIRLAGLIRCIHQFARGEQPKEELELEDIERGIRAAEHYLGHALRMFKELVNKPGTQNLSEDVKKKFMALVLKLVEKTMLDNGRITVKQVREEYNQYVPDQIRIGSDKKMGEILRKFGLTITDGTEYANSRRGNCLVWDEAYQRFVGEQEDNPRDVKLHLVHEEK